MMGRAAVAVAVSLITGCTKPEAPPPEVVKVLDKDRVRVSADALANLGFARVDVTDFPETVPIMGKIAPTEDRTSVIPVRAAGRISEVLVSSGDAVTAGQSLARVFSPDYVAAREEFVQSVKKQAAGEADDFAGLADLARKKLASLGLLKSDIDALERAARGKEDDAHATEPNLVVRAPRSGVLVSKSAIIGNSVNAGDALFTVADLTQVWFLGDVYPEDLPKVKVAQEIVLAGAPGEPALRGKVSFISPMVDALSRTIKVRALVPNPDLHLRADMYLQGKLLLKAERALTIPVRAITQGEGGAAVFKVDGPREVDGRKADLSLARVRVKLGPERDGRTAVLEGLSAGDEVVADGAILIKSALDTAGRARD